jgi:hypothetical protein
MMDAVHRLNGSGFIFENFFPFCKSNIDIRYSRGHLETSAWKRKTEVTFGWRAFKGGLQKLKRSLSITCCDALRYPWPHANYNIILNENTFLALIKWSGKLFKSLYDWDRCL